MRCGFFGGASGHICSRESIRTGSVGPSSHCLLEGGHGEGHWTPHLRFQPFLPQNYVLIIHSLEVWSEVIREYINWGKLTEEPQSTWARTGHHPHQMKPFHGSWIRITHALLVSWINSDIYLVESRFGWPLRFLF